MSDLQDETPTPEPAAASPEPVVEEPAEPEAPAEEAAAEVAADSQESSDEPSALMTPMATASWYPLLSRATRVKRVSRTSSSPVVVNATTISSRPVSSLSASTSSRAVSGS